MKILISGLPDSGQKQLINRIIGRDVFSGSSSIAGFVREHEFDTKYFKASCGIWGDEFQNCGEWCQEFCSDEATEVRNAILIFILTIGTESPDIYGLDGFVNALNRPGACLAVTKPGVKLSPSAEAQLNNIGFDIVSEREVMPIIHTALYDANLNEEDSDGDSSASLDGHASLHPPRELDEIMDELKAALHSKTMTNAEKKQLAERLADEIVQ